MRLPRGYIEYMARALVERLIAAGALEPPAPDQPRERLRSVVLEELAVEDRINDKVREYMNQYADEIRRGGISYQEMFKRIKSELVRRGEGGLLKRGGRGKKQRACPPAGGVSLSEVLLGRAEEAGRRLSARRKRKGPGIVRALVLSGRVSLGPPLQDRGLVLFALFLLLFLGG